MENTDPLGKKLHTRLKKLQADRTNFDTTWERIARVVLPTSAGFVTSYAPGANLNQDIFDSTAQLALPRFAAAIDTLVTPQTNKWHMLAPQTKRLKSNDNVTRFLSALNDMLFALRYQPRANFATRVFETYMSLGAFGSGILYIHDARPGIRYMAIHLSEFWYDENHEGTIDTGFWVHEYTLRQADAKWPGKLPEHLKDDLKHKPDRRVKFCQAVYPREDRDTRQRNAKNMPFASCTFVVDDSCTIMDESGYRLFPFAVNRYVTAPREIYARGPAHDALADVLTLQMMAKTSLRYGERAADPTYMAGDADNLDPFSSRPGAVNYGYLSPDGQDKIKVVELGGNPGFSLELMDQRRQSVNGAFLVNLFQVLVEQGSDRMTATEVMQRVQEKGALLGPVGGRLRTEFLGPIVERELDILFHAGVIRPEDIPPELAEDGGMFDIEYDSPLTRAMKAEEGVGILRTLEFAGQIAQFDQTVMRKINSARALERMADINGAPPDILFSADEMTAKDERDNSELLAKQALEAAPVIADTAKTLAETQQISNNQTGLI